MNESVFITVEQRCLWSLPVPPLARIHRIWRQAKINQSNAAV